MNNQFNIDNFEYNKNYVLEASAGTGKTYSIMQMVKKLVIDFNVPLEKILIVTYTDKACGELRNRLRAVLEELKSKYSNDKENLEKVLKALAQVDYANIYTIHSFCTNTIKEFSLTLNRPTGLNVASSLDLKAFISNYILSNEEYRNYFFSNEKEFKKTVKNLVGIITNYYLNKNGQEVPEIISYLPPYSTPVVLQMVEQLSKCSTFEDALKYVDDFEKNYEFLCNSGKQFYIEYANKIKSDFLSPNSYSYHHKLSTKVKDYYKNIKEALIILTDKFYKKETITKLYLDYEHYKKINKKQTFGDMIHTVREAINTNDELLNKIRKKYRYGIIDEFQDTNETQFSIFSKIFLCRDHNLIVVGDPKQSIYSFQGADLEVYMKAVPLISDPATNGEFQVLNKNYRSSKAVVESCNKVFEEISSSDPESFSFSPSQYLTNEIDGKEHRATFHNKLITKGILTTEKELSDDEFAQLVCQFIIDCCSLNDEGHTNLRISNRKDCSDKNLYDVTFNDFCILTRLSYEMEPIQKALRYCGIPYVRYKEPGLFKGVEAFHFITIFEALNVPNFRGSNRNFLNRILFTGFFNQSLQEIHSEKYVSDDSEEIKLIIFWKSLVKQNLWEDLITSIIIDSKLMSYLSTLNEQSTLSKYRQIGDYCVDYLSNGHSIEDLIKHLRELYSFGNAEDEGSDIVNKNTDSACVKIMTMHASKGLQFPIVINFAGYSQLPDKPPYMYQYNGNRVISITPSEIVDLSEEVRLWYVAYTRAVQLLVLPNFDEPNFNETINAKFLKNWPDYYDYFDYPFESFSLLEKKVKKILSPINKNNISNSVEIETQMEELKKLIKESPSKRSYKHSYSSLSHGKDESYYEEDEVYIDKDGEETIGLSDFDKSAIQIDGDYRSDIEPISIPSNYPKGAGLGNALHEVFEDIDFTNHNSYLDEIIKDKFIKQAISPKDEFISATKEMVDNVLNAKLPTVLGNKDLNTYIKLCDITNNNKKAEMEFNFNFIDERLKNYCNGFIDLVFKVDDRYSILDWKSDQLNDEDFESYSNKDDIKLHVDNSYSIQRVLYSYCLIKWLKNYYPELNEQEIFEQHFGGIYYIFLRGCNKDTSNGVYLQTWDKYQDIEDAFNLIIKERSKK